MNTVAAPKIDRTTRFTEETWNRIVSTVSRAFGFSPIETEAFRDKKIAKLIGLIPFAAGCGNPERIAVAHLGTYILSVRAKEYFNPVPEDDANVFSRLDLISHFPGGDPDIVRKGMALLTLNMIADYQRDVDEDVQIGKYNPIASGSFDYETIKDGLIEIIERVECPEMDAVLDVEGSLEAFWNYP